MDIIRDLDESDNLVEPLTRDKRITFWNHCYKNAKHPDGTNAYKIMELDMFGSCEILNSSNCDNTSCSDIESFSPLLSQEIRSY